MDKVKEQRKSAQKSGGRRAFDLLLALAALTFWVGVWWLAALKVGKEWILPTPLRVAVSIGEAAREGQLFLRIGRSVRSILLGYIGGLVPGVLFAALTARVKPLHILFSPLLTVVRATPVASFILILWVFFARSGVPAVCAALVVMPIVWSNCEQGFLSVDKKGREVAQVYGFGFWRRLRYLTVPAVSPFFAAAAKTSLGMAWKAGIAAEVLCSPDGTLGQMILFAKRDVQTSDLFAWTLCAVAVCFLIEKLPYFVSLAAKACKKAKNRRESARKGEKCHDRA